VPPSETRPCSSAGWGTRDAVLLLLDLGLGRRTDVHDRDIAESLREALLRLLAVEVRVDGRRAIRTAGSAAHGPVGSFRVRWSVSEGL
jgi:hypothetical protein